MLNRNNKGQFIKGHKLGMTGKKHSLKTKQIMGRKCLKEKRWNWKGGISSLNKRIYQSYKYRQWRSDVFTRDDFVCQNCGRKGNYLEAHHKKEFSIIMAKYKIKSIEKALACEELWNINNGETLCDKCHNKTKRGNPKFWVK